jgi:hypothetical protein
MYEQAWFGEWPIHGALVGKYANLNEVEACLAQIEAEGERLRRQSR